MARKINGNGLNGEELSINGDGLNVRTKATKPKPKVLPGNSPVSKAKPGPKTGSKPRTQTEKKDPSIDLVNLSSYRSVGADGFSFILGSHMISVTTDGMNATVVIVSLADRTVPYMKTFKGVPHVDISDGVKVAIVGSDGGSLVSAWMYNFQFKTKCSTVNRFTNSVEAPKRVAKSPKPNSEGGFVLTPSTSSDCGPMTYFIGDGAVTFNNGNGRYLVSVSGRTLVVRNMDTNAIIEFDQGDAITSSYTLTKHNVENIIAAITAGGGPVPLLRFIKNFSHMPASA